LEGPYEKVAEAARLLPARALPPPCTRVSGCVGHLSPCSRPPSRCCSLAGGGWHCRGGQSLAQGPRFWPRGVCWLSPSPAGPAGLCCVPGNVKPGDEMLNLFPI